MPEEKVEQFGGDTPLEHPGQPVELAPVYVMLAPDEANYASGARVAVARGSADPVTVAPHGVRSW